MCIAFLIHWNVDPALHLATARNRARGFWSVCLKIKHPPRGIFGEIRNWMWVHTQACQTGTIFLLWVTKHISIPSMDASSTGTKPMTPEELDAWRTALQQMTPDEQFQQMTPYEQRNYRTALGYFPPVPTPSSLTEEEFNTRVAALELYVQANFRDN